MNSLGIYFGNKDINLVETKGKKIINNIRLPHPNSGMAELEEKVPIDIKIIALLKDAFRTYHINVEEVSICISGQDLVIRTFEIPLIPQNELNRAVSFEIKKYIPFKLEELNYDFQVIRNKQNKINLVLFVGIKKEILDSYISIFKQLNLKIKLLEYSAFSVLRFLKLIGINDAGVKASLCFDLNNEDEANFTVFEDGFSLFSRDFVLAGEPVGFEQITEVDRSQKLEKLKNEIRISLDYYKRKFPEKNIKDIFIVSDKESHQEIGAFFKESSIFVKFAETQKLLGKDTFYSSTLVKSFATSLYKLAVLKIKVELLGAKIKAAKVMAIKEKPSTLLEGLKLDFRFIMLGIVVCAAVYVYGWLRTTPIQEEIAGTINNRVKIKTVIQGGSIDELSAVGAKFRKKIRALDNVIKNQTYTTYLLETIPKVLPRGVWLDSFVFNQTAENKPELILNGKVYLADSDREFQSVNDFLANLKNDPIFSKYFNEISLSSIDRKVDQDKNLVVFIIVCKNS